MPFVVTELEGEMGVVQHALEHLGLEASQRLHNQIRHHRFRGGLPARQQFTLDLLGATLGACDVQGLKRAGIKRRILDPP